MSTRAHIGIVNQDGTVTSIYVHRNEKTEAVADLLLHYNTEEKVRALIDLGDLRFFGATPNIPDTEAYHRDMGEAWEDVKPYTCDPQDFIYNTAEDDLTFLFGLDGKWKFREWANPLENL